MFLIIDTNNIYWRAYHGLKAELESDDHEPTHAMHGTVLTVASLIRRLEPTHVLVTFDWGRSKYRSAIYPEYKAGPDPDWKLNANDQKEHLILLLKSLGFFVYRENGVEADDIIAKALQKAPRGKQIVIVSGDKDLRQLINKGVSVLAPALGGIPEKWWDTQAVVEKYGVIPAELPHFLALTGDSSDGIGGVPGVGPKTAAKFIQQYASAIEAVLAGEKKLNGYGSLIDRNLQLVTLDGNPARCDFEFDDLKLALTSPDSIESIQTKGIFDRYSLDYLKRRWIAGTLFEEPRIIGRRMKVN